MTKRIQRASLDQKGNAINPESDNPTAAVANVDEIDAESLASSAQVLVSSYQRFGAAAQQMKQILQKTGAIVESLKLLEEKGPQNK